MSDRGIRTRYGWVAVIGLAVVVGLTAVWIGGVQENAARGQQAVAAAAPAAENLGTPAAPGDPQAVAAAQGLSRAFRAAAQRVVPTVVLIRTTTRAHQLSESPKGSPSPHRGRNPFKGTPFEDFFGDDNEFGSGGHPYVPRQEGVGSGVIIHPSGIILTNAHVVDDADEVSVGLGDGRKFTATDIKLDARTDLAVLRIKTDEKLPAATLGDSSKMEIGDWVIAVGNPLELEHTVSAGIISGTKRSLPSSPRADFIQTDAAINPGNSGGPLVSLNGEVIGINTAIASSSGGFQGIGFAIPSNLAKWVAQQLISKGAVARAYLGVGIADVTNELADKFGVKPGQGVLVSQVFPDSPAARSGLREGDVVTAVAGQTVHSTHELQELVERAPFGSRQQLSVIRDGKPVTLAVEVQAMPKTYGTASAGRSRSQEDEQSTYKNRELGLELSDLTPELAARLGMKGVQGALVTGVADDSLAADAGLRQGMVILKVGHTPVANAEDFEKAMKNESLKSGVLLLVRAGGSNRFLVLPQK